MQKINEFIEYLSVIEENLTVLSDDQIKKLELIKSKVVELVKKVEAYSPEEIKIGVEEPMLMENGVLPFSAYTELNEMIKRRGNKWIVTDKSGKDVLGTHPSKEKALKQLRAIEISKMRG
jgi:hypothetical protein